MISIYGHEGIVISRRGKNYWNVRLNAVGDRREVIIYKRADSLVVCLGDQADCVAPAMAASVSRPMSWEHSQM